MYFSTRIKTCVTVFSIYASIMIGVNLVEYNRIVKIDRRSEKSLEDKVILAWNEYFGDPFYGFGGGRSGFVDYECEHANCYLTDNKLFMPQHEFDAILFHGFQFYELLSGKPKHRSERQLYVFVSLESAANTEIPARHSFFYNVTMTYRLDSDIPWTYLRVKDMKGEVVAPSFQPTWMISNVTRKTRRKMDVLMRKRTKAAAWFVSDCVSRNNREGYVRELLKYIKVDIYGKCGNLSCPLSESERCNRILQSDYFFYIAFENSNCKDYVTEKVYNALNTDTIPIIYSGANLTRFFPPNSYIDAARLTPKQLADKMNTLMKNEEEYLSYFWWKDFYYFERTVPYFVKPDKNHPFCKLCEILNTGYSHSLNIKNWWNDEGR